MPWNEPVARYDSSPGISIEKLGVGSLFVKPPIWKIENDAGSWVSQSASVAAIFIGCAFVVWIPNALPQQSCNAVSGIRSTIASFAGGAEHLDVAALPKMPRRHAEDDETAGQATGQDHVDVGEDRELLEHDLAMSFACAVPVVSLIS